MDNGTDKVFREDRFTQISELRAFEARRFSNSLYRKFSDKIKPRAERRSSVRLIMQGGKLCTNTQC